MLIDNILDMNISFKFSHRDYNHYMYIKDILAVIIQIRKNLQQINSVIILVRAVAYKHVIIASL